MRISSKGQVTIPLAIRQKFGLEPGTDVQFGVEQGKVILLAKRETGSQVENWLKKAIGVAQGRTTTAKVMKLTRGED